MERWWTAKEIPAARPYLRELFHRDIGFSDFDTRVVEAVLRLAARGKVEVGEVNGSAIVRDPEWVYHPNSRNSATRPPRRAPGLESHAGSPSREQGPADSELQ